MDVWNQATAWHRRLITAVTVARHVDVLDPVPSAIQVAEGINTFLGKKEWYSTVSRGAMTPSAQRAGLSGKPAIDKLKNDDSKNNSKEKEQEQDEEEEENKEKEEGGAKEEEKEEEARLQLEPAGYSSGS